MSKVKLDPRSKDFVQLAAFATTPIPTVATFNAVLLAYQTALNDIAAAEIKLETLRAVREATRLPLEVNLNNRGNYVQTQSGGDSAQIFSAAFEVQADPSSTTHMEKPYNLVATMGDSEGEIDLSCHAVLKAGGYVFQRREHSDVTAPGAWGSDQFSTRSSASSVGLVSGNKYAFRTKAMGPNDLESAWSDEVICMAP